MRYGKSIYFLLQAKAQAESGKKVLIAGHDQKALLAKFWQVFSRAE